MKTITFLGSNKETEYHGYDGDDVISLRPGDEAIVSDAKAAQVAADFPTLFLVDGKTPPKPKHAAPAPAAEDDEQSGAGVEDEDLAALLDNSAADLTARAEKLGIEGVGKKGLKTKQEIAEAILAKLDESDDEDEGGAES